MSDGEQGARGLRRYVARGMMDAVAGMRVSEWADLTLGDVLEVKHGFAFKGEYFGEGGETRVVTPGNFHENGGFRDRGAVQKSYAGPVPNGYRLKPGALVVAMTEQSPGLLGSSALIPDDGKTWLHNQRIGLVLPDPGAVDNRFVYYLLNDPSVRDQISATATGAKVRHTAPRRIEAVRARIPPLATQRRIAAVLSAFEELIEINERRIELLEDLARSLYREWFVHFRFPGREDTELVDSGLGPIPEGWTMTTLDAVASVVMGQSPKSNFYNQVGDGLPFHQGVAGFRALLPVHDKYCIVEARTAQPLDVLCSVRAPVGRLNLADQRMVIGRGLSAIRRTDGCQAFLLLQLRQALGQEDSIGGGTIYKAIGKSQLAGLPVLEPHKGWIERFEAVARPLLDERIEVTLMNRQLAATHDLLLPRLVTGRLDISDIDLGVLTPADDK